MSSTTASAPEPDPWRVRLKRIEALREADPDANEPCKDCGEPVPAKRTEQLLRLARKWTAQELEEIPWCEHCGRRLTDEALQRSLPTPMAPADLERRRVENSGLPPVYWEVHLREAQEDVKAAVLEQLHAWAMLGEPPKPDEVARGVFLHGKVGRGKSWLAGAAARSMLRHRPVRWTSVPTLVNRWYSAFGSEDRNNALATLLGTEALVLDDLGQERPSDEVRQVLFTAIDDRMTRRAPLFITSNLLPGELGERYGAWLPSRIQGYCFTARIEGDDRRLRAL